MTSLSKRLLLLYVGLVLALSALGSHNQALRAERVSLMNYKAQLELKRVDLRAETATVTGPMAVRAWAYGAGMQPATTLQEAMDVAKSEPPIIATRETGLEIRTIWR